MIFYREEFSLSSVETQVHVIDEEIVTSKDEAILKCRDRTMVNIDDEMRTMKMNEMTYNYENKDDGDKCEEFGRDDENDGKHEENKDQAVKEEFEAVKEEFDDAVKEELMMQLRKSLMMQLRKSLMMQLRKSLDEMTTSLKMRLI